MFVYIESKSISSCAPIYHAPRRRITPPATLVMTLRHGPHHPPGLRRTAPLFLALEAGVGTWVA